MAEGGSLKGDSDLDISDEEENEEFEGNDEQLYKNFKKAADHLKTKVGEMDSETLLYFYARYKQANEGPCNVSKPGFFDFQGKQKWVAWKNLGDMPREEAMLQYVEEMKQIDPSWNIESEQSSHNKKNKTMGPVMSTMSSTHIDEELSEEQKTVFDLVKDGNVEQVKNVLSAESCLINQKDEEGLSLLHWACDRGHLEVVKALLKQHIDINAQAEDGQTALHYASSCGHEDIVNILLHHGASVDIADCDGLLPKDVALSETTLLLFPS